MMEKLAALIDDMQRVFTKLIKLQEADPPAFLFENSLRAVLTAHSFASAALMVGPEGGFADEEARDAVQGGLASVSLGPRILRCETAPLAAITAVLYESGNL